MTGHTIGPEKGTETREIIIKGVVPAGRGPVQEATMEVSSGEKEEEGEDHPTTRAAETEEVVALGEVTGMTPTTGAIGPRGTGTTEIQEEATEETTAETSPPAPKKHQSSKHQRDQAPAPAKAERIRVQDFRDTAMAKEGIDSETYIKT